MVFKMYIGVSGSGKSYVAGKEAAQDDLILDSDMLRIELFNDVNEQTHNDKLFAEMNKRAIEGLRANRTVHYVATNLSSKKRIATLQYIKKNVLGVRCECIVISAPTHICKERNNARERHVPEYVIDRQVRAFQIPYRGEGWDSIHVIQNWDTNDIEWINRIWNDVKEFGEQGNPHHTLTLYGHLLKCIEEVKLKKDNIDKDARLLIAAALHDIGKVYTRSIDNKGISHYYGHENVSAAIALCMTNDFYSTQLINYHMLPYQDSAAQSKWKERLSKNLWNDLLILNAADRHAK